MSNTCAILMAKWLIITLYAPFDVKEDTAGVFGPVCSIEIGNLNWKNVNLDNKSWSQRFSVESYKTLYIQESFLENATWMDDEYLRKNSCKQNIVATKNIKLDLLKY